MAILGEFRGEGSQPPWRGEDIWTQGWEEPLLLFISCYLFLSTKLPL